MEQIISDLQYSLNISEESSIIAHLNIIISQAESLIIKDITTFKYLLTFQSRNVQILSAEAIAELCKENENRESFTDEEIIYQLMQFLELGDNELAFTTIRALGNICYENEAASSIIDKIGIENILNILKDDSIRDNDSLTIKVSALMVNLLHTYEYLPKTALAGGILPLVEQLLEKYKHPIESNKILIPFLLSIINAVTDYLDDQLFVISDSLLNILIELLKKSEIPEIGILCLEIFQPLAEKDKIKMLLANNGIGEKLYDLIEKYKEKVNDEESRAILKMACDLIVVILTGDSCMELLYDKGNGKMYFNMLNWLNSDDHDLLSTGILAIGNFARKDKNCIEMVRNGIARKLINILKKYNESTDMNIFKIQYALLSSMKNLIIPKENKSQVLKDNIIDVMYPMLKLETLMVVFKLLGTFRMLIDGQSEVASILLSRKYFLERLVYWCNNSDHLGVRGEVPRIFSWLIKNVNSTDHFPTFINVPDTVKCITEMISSNHGVMQNEAFIALNILSATLDQNNLDHFFTCLCKAEIGKHLKFALNNYGQQWESCTIENCLILVQNLRKSDLVKKDLGENGINGYLEKLKCSSNYPDKITK